MVNGLDDKVFHPPGVDFTITIPINAWNTMPRGLQKAIEFLVTNWQKSPTFAQAFNHIDNKGVERVAIDANGLSYKPNNPAAHIIYSASDDYTTRVEINNPLVTIEFNSSRLAQMQSINEEAFMNILVHEFFHPFVPNLSGHDSDEPTVQSLSATATSELYGPNPTITAPTASSSIAVAGSYLSDVIYGTQDNDVLSGMSGNDVIYGGYGSNVIYGGVGYDIIYISGVNDLLLGGLDADTYIVEISSVSLNILDIGGVEEVQFSQSIYDFQFFKIGNHLIVSGNNGQVGAEYVIDNFFLSANDSRIEIFTFSDGSYASSYIEHLANGGTPGVCYDAHGWQIVCSDFGLPIVLDISGDGISIKDRSTSNVIMDVDGDGLGEAISWITNSDAVLVYDRNKDGIVSDFLELTLFYDFRGAGSDLEGLLAHDSNRDGFITSEDSIHDSLLVWVDENENGISESGELMSAGEFGLTEIGLEIKNRTPLNQGEDFSQILGTSQGTVSGSAITIYDVAFKYSSINQTCECCSSVNQSFSTNLNALNEFQV